VTTASLPSPTTAPWPEAGGATVAETTDHRDGPGRLRIDPRVVQKLAAQAANEVHGVSQASAGPIGRAIHRPVPASTPADQLAIDLDLTVSIRYPMSLRVVGDQLAAHVARRVEQLTGRPVGRVRVTVQRLGGATAGDDRPRVR
jgi:uncharacterized alkaline shock family protein YloU